MRARRRHLGSPLGFLVFLFLNSSAHSQQSTGQMLIAAGFNPIAATTPEMVKKLMSLPANQFQQRQKAGRTYYVYADPSGCTCAYVGSPQAMKRYSSSLGTPLPTDWVPQGGGISAEQEVMSGIESDDAAAQFNSDVFGPDF